MSSLPRTGDLKLMQDLNRYIILDVIRKSGPISRSEIAKRKGISPTTVASAVRGLLRDGIVTEIGVGVSSGGRRPILLQFDPDNKFIIAVSVTNSDVTAAEVNLAATIRRKERAAFPAGAEFEAVEAVLLHVERFLHTVARLDSCLGISFSVPGIVDSQNGVVRFTDILHLRNVPLKQRAEERFGMPVWVENDANAVVLGETRFGRYRDARDLAFVKVSDGVGLGSIVNGTLARGHGGGAGEFGHMIITQSGEPCPGCGNRGCLNSFVCWESILARIRTRAELGERGPLADRLRAQAATPTPESFRRAAADGDRMAVEICAEVAEYLATGLVNLIHLCNPRVVVLGGEVLHGNALLLEDVRRRVKTRTMAPFAEDLEVAEASFGSDFELIGATAVILDEIFQHPMAA